MSCLPVHGRIDCPICFQERPVIFDETKRSQDGWRITANPMAWGSSEPEIIVLGFSKGPTQAGALNKVEHDEIAYKGRRTNVGKILAHVGLLPDVAPEQLHAEVDRLISSQNGRFHFSSFIRCTVERLDLKSGEWKGTNGGMLDGFMKSSLGNYVVNQCATRFLGALPSSTKLVVMFGTGSNLMYVEAALSALKIARPGSWSRLNDIAYSDGTITVVHVEHFASQGSLIPDWLGIGEKPRARLGRLARTTVQRAVGLKWKQVRRRRRLGNSS